MSLDLNVTIVFVLVMLAVALIYLNVLVFSPFLKLFEERYERLEGSVQRADEMLARAEEQAQAFTQRIKVATTRGLEARDNIRSRAQAQLAERLDEQRAQLAEKLATAMGELETKRQKALTDVDAQAQQLAQVTAAKLLGRAL